MNHLRAGILLLMVLAVAAPAAAQVCQAIPKQITGRVLSSADGAASATSPGFTVKATDTRTGAVATSTALVGSSYWFDAGTTWGTWCVGDTVQVAVSVSTGSGPYSAAVTKTLTTANPEVFPDATLAPGEAPPPPAAPSATPAPSVPSPVPTVGPTAAPSAVAPAGPQAVATPTPKATATPARTPAPSQTATPAPPGLAPGAPSAATPAPGDGTFLPPVPTGPARSPGFELLGGAAALGFAAFFTGRRR